MNLYLIRHGEKQDAGKGPDILGLTKKGFKQADLLGQRLVKYRIEKIYTSDMLRAVQTSQEINKYLNVEIIVKHDLREIDMGECQNGWDSIAERYPDFMEKFSNHVIDVPYPRGECGMDVWLRSLNVVNQIVSTGFNNVAIVTHGGTIRCLVSGLLGLGQERRFIIGAPFENCSISIVKYDESDRRFYIHTINDYSHLERCC